MVQDVKTYQIRRHTDKRTQKSRRRQRLNCPCCMKGRIIDSKTEIHTRLYDMEVADELGIDVDYIAKCNFCKKEIGIKKF